jgi:hypothetical protein
MSSAEKSTVSNPVDWARAAANIVFAVAQILASQITAQMGVNDIGTRSAQSPSLLTPPDFSFAIWGLIFLAMAAYSAYQALPGNLGNARLRQIGWWTAAAMALNSAWELATVEYGITFISVILIIAMFTVLMRTFYLLNRPAPSEKRETIFIVFPVSIFAAWITVASILNSWSWLRNAGGYSGAPFSDAVWVAILAVTGSLLGMLIMRLSRANIFFAAVLIWAFGGILYKGAMLDEPLVVGGGALALVIVVVSYIAFARSPLPIETSPDAQWI